MVDIQDKIHTIKTEVKMKIYSLKDEINNLEEDVNYYSNKMTDWSTKIKLNELLPSSHYKQNIFLKHRVKVSIFFCIHKCAQIVVNLLCSLFGFAFK